MIKFPKELSKEGREIWRKLSQEFIFERSDEILLQQLCDCLDRVHLAQSIVKKEGIVLESNGSKKRHPAVEAERVARAQLIEIWKTLRLNARPDEHLARPGRPPGGSKRKEIPTWLSEE